MNKFEEVLKENKSKYRSRALEMQRKRIKKENRKNNIIFLLIYSFIMLSTILNMVLFAKIIG